MTVRKYTKFKSIKATGNIQILFGNLAEEGCVAKISGNEGGILKEMLLFMKMSMMSSPEFGGEVKP
jgi:dihydroxy-acid dehydratase